MNALTSTMSGGNVKKEEFARLLLNWRAKHGWNREESAAKLGVSHRTLQEWEQRRRVPSGMAQRGVFARMQEIDQSNG
jgi:ribosome-binding protein aMBF1 (putative translation factor)